MVCSFIVRLTPRKFLYAVAQTIGLLGYRLLSTQRKIALENLDIAFGNSKSKEEKNRIARDSFCAMVKSGFEILHIIDNPAQITQWITFRDKDILDKALSRGKGVILVSAHFGNFPLMLGRLSKEGYPTAAIMRPMRDVRTEKLFAKKRGTYGIMTVYSQPRKACVEDSIRRLRKNELLFILLDQHFGTAGVFVDFFGRKAATATGPITLAQRTQAVILPCFIVRHQDNTHSIMFDQPFELRQGGTEDETISVNIQALTTLIELYICRYPAQWAWIHRRWKS